MCGDFPAAFMLLCFMNNITRRHLPIGPWKVDMEPSVFPVAPVSYVVSDQSSFPKELEKHLPSLSLCVQNGPHILRTRALCLPFLHWREICHCVLSDCNKVDLFLSGLVISLWIVHFYHGVNINPHLPVKNIRFMDMFYLPFPKLIFGIFSFK